MTVHRVLLNFQIISSVEEAELINSWFYPRHTLLIIKVYRLPPVFPRQDTRSRGQHLRQRLEPNCTAAETWRQPLATATRTMRHLGHCACLAAWMAACDHRQRTLCWLGRRSHSNNDSGGLVLHSEFRALGELGILPSKSHNCCLCVRFCTMWGSSTFTDPLVNLRWGEHI